MRVTRPLTVDDAPVLAQLLQANRDFLAPWEPTRGESYFTVDGQRAIIRDLLERHQRGYALAHVIVAESGHVIGRITLTGIERGPFQSCNVGYWVSAAHNGRGFATAAVGEMVRRAFDDLGLHRVQAAAHVHNVRSQRVLERNRFVRFGIAPAYLLINGRWQDHALYQKVKIDAAATAR
jgi:ribosomal-protein-alanine N-acetyltransferase